MTKELMQKTIGREVACSGIGVHSGRPVRLCVKPAPENHGIKFARTDLPGQPPIPARFNRVVDTSLATVIGSDGFIVSTIEHLMAALSGLGIDNALVEVDAHELPIMDGSAGPFVALLQSAGVVDQDAPRFYLIIEHPLELEEENKFVGIYPASHYRITCTIEYAHPLIGNQTKDVVITPGHFAKQIAGARTFGFLHEVEYMQKYGLAQGGSLDNAVVIDGDRVLNEGGLRYADEFVRHKLLDCVGDFSLLGLPLIGHVVTKRSGHAFNHSLLEKIFLEKGAWRTSTLEQSPSRSAPLKQLAN
ncbi:UDP-3-O-acyl-N-acetylglucosamine deacetylase [Desulfatitalea alkaliphila]|uniref:UDP-3-O-acyl-N-acetylglucosamine deacetylase n=1 Tax=Desulfatitalea alkaliphila TaxID=2929485 RepID=A0AA41R1T1_9BACT|nr:UDP-3-O-acyl-N-acetylglucosamine deacetylase [Desulfatitalea alkaliphila]MCJ8500944.1 UDP-3-O-acyl-N-acetylglucosamine deacetylase [Desulfatitalea alkaliphila]